MVTENPTPIDDSENELIDIPAEEEADAPAEYVDDAVPADEEADE